MKTQVHEHQWVTVALVGNVPTDNGTLPGYHIKACRGCGWAAPEPSESFLMATHEHRSMIEHELWTVGLRMCFTGEES